MDILSICVSVCLCNRCLLDRERTILPAGRERPSSLCDLGLYPCTWRTGRVLPKGGFWGAGWASPTNVRYAHMQGLSNEGPQDIRILAPGSACQLAEFCGYIRLFFAYTVLMFPGPESAKLVVVQCKGCHENIPAPVEGMPAQPIAARCPLCHEHRRYLPSEVFLGRLSHLMIRKPVRTADGRVG